MLLTVTLFTYKKRYVLVYIIHVFLNFHRNCPQFSALGRSLNPSTCTSLIIVPLSVETTLECYNDLIPLLNFSLISSVLFLYCMSLLQVVQVPKPKNHKSQSFSCWTYVNKKSASSACTTDTCSRISIVEINNI